MTRWPPRGVPERSAWCSGRSGRHGRPDAGPVALLPREFEPQHLELSPPAIAGSAASPNPAPGESAADGSSGSVNVGSVVHDCG
jgi:hypothetical protein